MNKENQRERFNGRTTKKKQFIYIFREFRVLRVLFFVDSLLHELMNNLFAFTFYRTFWHGIVQVKELILIYYEKFKFFANEQTREIKFMIENHSESIRTNSDITINVIRRRLFAESFNIFKLILIFFFLFSPLIRECVCVVLM